MELPAVLRGPVRVLCAGLGDRGEVAGGEVATEGRDNSFCEMFTAVGEPGVEL